MQSTHAGFSLLKNKLLELDFVSIVYEHVA